MKVRKKDLINLVKILQEKLDNSYSLKDEDFIDVSGNYEIKEEFILSTKWGIKAGNEEGGDFLHPILNKKFDHYWSSKNYDQYILFNGYFCKEDIVENQSFGKNLPRDYQEVTIEEFKKYIYKE